MARSLRQAVWIGALVLAVAGLARRGDAWGFTAHRMVNRKAIGTLPEPLRAFFAANAAYVVEHSIDPDLWRGVDYPAEFPNHFLDMDAFAVYPFDTIPRVEAEHLAKYGPDAGARGRLPWRLAEEYRALVAAFRARDAHRTLQHAAFLGHYVGDAHVPLHACLNYDGQLTGQTGFHSRWESGMVERFERQIDAQVLPAETPAAGDPVTLAFGALVESYAGSLAALESDRASVGPRDRAETPEDDRYDDAYFSKLYEREGPRVVSRLSSSASALASLWLEAWVEAGRPPLDASFRQPYVRKEARALLVSLDGAAAPIIDEAVARGLLPHVARLRAEGAVARGSITSIPSKTASGHAALYTGAWSDRNGITGNDVPVPGASVLEMNTGYSSTHLRAEPIWITAARQGLDVSVTAATQVYPFTPFLEQKRFGGYFGRGLTLVDAYRGYRVPDAVYGAADLSIGPAQGWLGEMPAHRGPMRGIGLRLADTQVDGLLYDDPEDPVDGLDTLYLSLDRDARGGVRLKAEPPRGVDPSAFAGLTVKLGGGEAAVYFRLYSLAPDGTHILLYQSSPQVIRCNKTQLEAAAYAATGGFVGNGAAELYERGDLGPTLWQGGDGTAERRYLETVGLVARQFRRLTDFSFDRTAWDLLLTYLPYPDEALHLWLGYLEPSLPGHDRALASRLRPFLDQVLAVVDDYVGHLAGRAGGDLILALASDHGMIGAGRLVRPNVALARAGLLSVDAHGDIDLARTRAVYFVGNSGYVLINRTSREKGIVPPSEEEEVRRGVVAALRGVKDPATGRVVIQAVLDPRTQGAGMGLGGPMGGDLYLSLAPGYGTGIEATGDLFESGPPKGIHVLDPDRREMQGAFVVAGPGVAPGADLGVIRQIDIAPTLCALLGIDPPAQAAGSVLQKALSRLVSSKPAHSRD